MKNQPISLKKKDYPKVYDESGNYRTAEPIISPKIVVRNNFYLGDDGELYPVKKEQPAVISNAPAQAARSITIQPEVTAPPVTAKPLAPVKPIVSPARIKDPPKTYAGERELFKVRGKYKRKSSVSTSVGLLLAAALMIICTAAGYAEIGFLIDLLLLIGGIALIDYASVSSGAKPEFYYIVTDKRVIRREGKNRTERMLSRVTSAEVVRRSLFRADLIFYTGYRYPMGFSFENLSLREARWAEEIINTEIAKERKKNTK